LISRNAAGQPAVFGPLAGFSNLTIQADLSADGRFVVFDSEAINLVPGIAAATGRRLYLRDRQSNTIQLVSLAPADVNLGGRWPSMDDAGSSVFFHCGRAEPLGPDRLCRFDIGSRAAEVVFVGVDPNSPIHVSALGNRVMFYRDVSAEPGACEPGTQCAVQPFVLDLTTHELTPLTRTTSGGYSTRRVFDVALNSDGSVAVLSTFTGTFFSDPRLPDFHPVVLVRYVDAARTLLVSRLESGEPAVCGALCGVFLPSISGDGNLVAFATNAFNFPGRNFANVPQAFVYDIAANRLELVSRNAANVPGDFGSSNNLQYTPFPEIEFYDTELSPRLSTDGRFVAFHSLSTNLAPDSGFLEVHTYLRRLPLRQATAIAVPTVSAWAIAAMAFGMLALVGWRWRTLAAPTVQGP
jgi:hypothetical protein